MYQVWECYQANGRYGKMVKRLGDFADFEQAKAFADKSYKELARIPESERVSVGVLALDGHFPYTVPTEH